MNNYKSTGEMITVTAPYALSSGDGCKVGSLFGVSAGDYLEAATDAELKTTGVFELVKDAGTAWSQGDKIYWDDSAKECDTDSAAGMLIGVAAEGAGSSAVLGMVRLNGTVSDLSEGAQAAVVTLTDSTGGSGTHDDTLADGLNSSAPAAITTYAAVVTLTNPVTKTEGETMSAALALAVSELTALRATVATMQSDAVIQNQNTSDLAQKVIEILARLVAAGIIDA